MEGEKLKSELHGQKGGRLISPPQLQDHVVPGQTERIVKVDEQS